MSRDRTTRGVGLACVAAATIGLATPAAAQEPGSRPTRDFVQASAQSDQFEIMEGVTVLAQSEDPQIRAFATQMIHDHQATTQSLIAAAARDGLMPPKPGLSGDQSQFLAALQSLRGRDFDAAYARQQVLAHHAALVTQQQYASSGDAPSVRQTAMSAVPVISTHLGMAEQLSASHKPAQ
jgi:putative membrane protein